MATTPATPFELVLQQAKKELGDEHLPNNPNILKADRVPDRMLELLAYSSPEIRAEALKAGLSQEQINRYQEGARKIEEQYFVPYNIPPLEFNEEVEFPAYYSKKESKLERSRGNVPPYDPAPPIGYDAYKEIKSYGINPRNEFVFEKTLDNFNYRKKLAHAPRNLAQRDIDYILNQFDVKGDIRFINPKKPELGLMIKQEGRDDWQVIDSPELTAQDTLDFILQEAPSLIGDLTLLKVGTMGAKVFGKTYKGLEPFLSGKAPGPLKRVTEVLTMSGLAAAGATGGDLIRLMVGASSPINAHDRDIVEMMKEAGTMGALSFAGTAAISTAMKVIPALYQKIFNKSIPPAFYTQMDEMYKQAEKTEAGNKLFPETTYGNEKTIKEIRNSIDELAKRTKTEITEYNPTLAARTGDPNAIDFEFIFLKNALDPDLSKMYNQIKLGNQKVIDDFLDALANEFGGKEISGETIASGIKVLVRTDIQNIRDQAEAAINKMRDQAGAGKDVSVTGETLLKEVRRPGPEFTQLMPKSMKRLDLMKTKYIQDANDKVVTAMRNPLYADTLTGTGALKQPAEQWSNATAKQTDDLFADIEAGEAKDLFYELLGTDGIALLNRLRGKGTIKKEVQSTREPFKTNAAGEQVPNMIEVSVAGMPKKANFNIQELNNMRKKLNAFASMPSVNATAEGYARALERGLERQMQTLIKEAAAIKTDYKGAELKRWMRDNNWGDDIRDAGIEQREAYKVANSNIILGLLQKEPEQVTEYILKTGTAGSKVNTRVNHLMKILNAHARPSEIQQIKKGFQAHIQKEIFDNPDLGPLEKTRAYRKFITKHQGTLRPIFGNDFLKFPTRKQFEKEIKKLENYDDQIEILRARFGSYADDAPAYGNIVEQVLDAPTIKKASGKAFSDQKYLLDIIRRDDTLAEQASLVTRNYILSSIQKRVPGYGGKSMIDPAALNDFLTKGFDEKGIYNYDNYIEPILGRLEGSALKKANPAQLKLHKEAKQFNEDLKYLNELIQLEEAITTKASSAAHAKATEQLAYPQTSYWRKYWIKPLTQFGRRMTALERQQGQRSSRMIGKLMLEPELFKIMMDAMRKNLTVEKTATAITAWGIATGRTEYANEIADELQYYDEKEIRQKPKDSDTIPKTSRILEMFEELEGTAREAFN